MAYTPGLGRTPAIAARRIAVSAAAAGAAFALGQWWPFGPAPGEEVVLPLFAVGIALFVGGLVAPSIAAGRPPRLVPVQAEGPTPGGVAIPGRAIQPMPFLIAGLVVFTLGGILGMAGGMEGPRGSSPVAWGVFAGASAYLTAYILVQRPWLRRMELRPDGFALCTGEERVWIAWEDVASIDRAPLRSSAGRGSSGIQAYNAAALTVTRHSDPGPPRARRLEDHYPVGDLACGFVPLLATLRHMVAVPADRARLATVEDAHSLPGL